MGIDVRAMALEETGAIIEYFRGATPEHLAMLGVDPHDYLLQPRGARGTSANTRFRSMRAKSSMRPTMRRCTGTAQSGSPIQATASSGPTKVTRAEFELPNRVYRIDGQTGKTTIIAEGPMRRPNGICFSPDFSKVYIVDTGATDGPDYPANILVFDVVKDGTAVSGGKVFADFKPGFSDGVRCDSDGNVWCSWGWVE